MGLPESSLSNTVETAEGWDEGWDDDWDEENAVKSQHTGNISANGLTSRTPNKAEWENDWDEQGFCSGNWNRKNEASVVQEKENENKIKGIRYLRDDVNRL